MPLRNDERAALRGTQRQGPRGRHAGQQYTGPAARGCPTKLIHAGFSSSDLREGDRQLTPWRFYGHSCQGGPVQPGVPERKRYEILHEDNPCPLPMRGHRFCDALFRASGSTCCSGQGQSGANSQAQQA
jgi:hypothetical protein